MIDPKTNKCDVVFEGGVTSAVIYAGLLERLSRTYGFECLGGTSAGAAAAAAGAIAERSRRSTGCQDAFDALGRLPQDLADTDPSGHTALFKLFQPQFNTRRGYQVLVAALRHAGPDGWRRAVGPVIWAAVREFRMAALIGAVPGLWLVVSTLGPGFTNGLSLARVITTGLGVLLILLLGPCAALIWGAWQTVCAMAANHFGLCNGMPEAGCDGEALTPTLHALYNKLSGRTAAERPVVFGDLWGDGAERGEAREIDLQMITTALNLQRPIRLPNAPGVDPLRGFFYDQNEWEKLFPAPVMEWLLLHQRYGKELEVKSRAGRALSPLPVPRCWPVVMAVRLSLSFPGLLSAVPMYALDERRGVEACGGRSGNVRFVADRVYFSDGGITSNCPIHLFDATLPTRPTFGVNLWQLEPDHGKNPVIKKPVIWMHGEASDPELRTRPFYVHSPLRAAAGFVAALVGTALNWRDSVQRVLPGYRERIVHIGLPANEGGLNLHMPKNVIIELGNAGAQAAERLVQEFTGPRTAGRINSWDHHRWVRMRSILAATHQHLADLSARLPLGVPAYRDLPKVLPQPPPRFVDAAAAAQARMLMDGMAELMAKVEAASNTTQQNENIPEPAPFLHMSPPW